MCCVDRPASTHTPRHGSRWSQIRRTATCHSPRLTLVLLHGAPAGCCDDSFAMRSLRGSVIAHHELANRACPGAASTAAPQLRRCTTAGVSVCGRQSCTLYRPVLMTGQARSGHPGSARTQPAATGRHRSIYDHHYVLNRSDEVACAPSVPFYAGAPRRAEVGSAAVT